MICPKCGSAIDDNARFCTYCGQMTAPQQTTEPGPVPAPTPEPAPETAATAVTEAAEAVVETPAETPAETSVNRCEYCGTEMEEGARLCPACGATIAGIGDIPLEKAIDIEEEYPAQPEQTAQSYAAAQPEQPAQAYAPDTQVQPLPADNQIPQQYAMPAQPQLIPPPVVAPVYGQPAQPAQPEAFVFCTNCGNKMEASVQFCPKCGKQRGSHGGQMPYTPPPPPQYGAYPPPQQPVYQGGAVNGGEPVNIPAAIIVLLLDVVLGVAFFLNTLFASNYIGNGSFSLFNTYEFFVMAFESINTFFEFIGRGIIDSGDMAVLLPGEMWMSLIFVLAIYVLYIISIICTIVAIVRAFTSRGPKAVKFWGSAGGAAGTALAAHITALVGTGLYNVNASGLLNGVPGAKYKEYMGVNWLFYVMLGVALLAAIIAGVMKSSVKKKYVPSIARNIPPQNNIYR